MSFLVRFSPLVGFASTTSARFWMLSFRSEWYSARRSMRSWLLAEGGFFRYGLNDDAERCDFLRLNELPVWCLRHPCLTHRGTDTALKLSYTCKRERQLAHLYTYIKRHLYTTDSTKTITNTYSVQQVNMKQKAFSFWTEHCRINLWFLVYHLSLTFTFGGI